LNNDLAAEESLKKFALWEYSAVYWAAHLEEVPREQWTTNTTQQVLELLQPHSPSLLNMVRLNDPDSRQKHSWKMLYSSLAPPLYYAVCLKAVQLTKVLLEDGADLNVYSDVAIFGNSLQRAANDGFETLVELLLKNGAEGNAIGGAYGTALQAAAYQGSENIVKVLLDVGADVNVRGGAYETALQAAAARGHESIVRTLLNHGADVNIHGGVYGTALQAAAYQGSENIVRVLLELGASVNVRGGGWDAALQAAATQ
jgi:ankyrin repeat protein